MLRSARFSHIKWPYSIAELRYNGNPKSRLAPAANFDVPDSALSRFHPPLLFEVFVRAWR
jgi:hypothetical protein